MFKSNHIHSLNKKAYTIVEFFSSSPRSSLASSSRYESKSKIMEKITLIKIDSNTRVFRESKYGICFDIKRKKLTLTPLEKIGKSLGSPALVYRYMYHFTKSDSFLWVGFFTSNLTKSMFNVNALNL